MRSLTTNTAPGSAGQNGALYIPEPQSPLAPWREDPLGAVALVVTMAILIFATGVASLL